MSRTPKAKSKDHRRIPTRFKQFGKKYPAIIDAYEALGEATQNAGPLDVKTRELVKLALAFGGWREGAVHSHSRRALQAGCTPDELRHVVLLAATTLGFPSMMAALTWVEDVLSDFSEAPSH
jgi:4-carboxymuconolactone decarboxylase